MSEFWKTAIAEVKQDQILVRGYPIEQLTERCSFGDVVYLLLTGQLPAGNEGRLVEAILVACCEHGLASPSVDAVRFVASCGVPLQTSVAAGVSAIGDVHGGAIEPCARILQAAVQNGETAEQLLQRLRDNGERMPGFGHRVHQRDPRGPVLMILAKELGLAGPHLQLACAIAEASEAVIGRRVNINVDGAVAALMCDMGIASALGKAFFIISRAPGYAAHAFEQVTAERPFKAVDPPDITYTGPARRDVPSK